MHERAAVDPAGPSQAIERDAPAGSPSQAALALQRRIGNARTGRLLGAVQRSAPRPLPNS